MTLAPFDMRCILLAGILLLNLQIVYAQNSFSSVQEGNWNDASTWTAGAGAGGVEGVDFPSASDQVIVDHNVIIDATNSGNDFAFSGFLTINAGDTLECQVGSADDGFVLQGDGIMVNNGSFFTIDASEDPTAFGHTPYEFRCIGNSTFIGGLNSFAFISDDWQLEGNAQVFIDNLLCYVVSDDVNFESTTCNMYGEGNIRIGGDGANSTVNFNGGSSAAQLDDGITIWRNTTSNDCSGVDVSTGTGTDNPPPFALDDAFSTQVSTADNQYVLTEGIDDFSPLTGDSVTLTSAGSNAGATNGATTEGGTVSVNNNGTPADPTDDFIVYTPLAGFTGTDTYNYLITNEAGETDIAEVTVTVNACGAGFTESISSTFATFESETNDVTDELNAEGAPDGAFAQIYSDNEQLVLDLGQIFTAGTEYQITWRRRNTITSGTATIDLSESTLPGSGFVAHPSSPTNTDHVNFTTTTVVANSNFRYLAFDKGNTNSVDYEIDAVGVIVSACIADNDGDGIADTVDIDDDNDGVLDLTENGGNDAEGDEDGDGIVNWMDVSDGGAGDGSTTDYTDTDGNGVPDVYDPDGDGVPSHLDLDSDNDGIADIIEAGGIDSNHDGRADVSTDTDSDGHSNTFDTDNGGTALADPDTDGDGLANRVDLDSDSDGLIDNVEGQTTAGFRSPANADTDGDGWDNRYDNDNGGVVITLSNNESAGNPDYIDTDSDGDGSLDYIEGFDDNESQDALDDLVLRASMFETAAGNPLFYVNGDDADADGTPDWLEDDDMDNVPNFLDFGNADYHDTDGDGLIDLFDTDNNGVATTFPDGDGDGEHDFRDINTSNTLPIELINFSATKLDGQVQLDWSTQTEINNDFFTIERSADGIHFEALQTHDGAGTTSRRNDYRSFDDTPLNGYNYYRLRQTDYDGQTAVFPVEVVFFSGNSSVQVNIYPNPSNGSELYLDITGMEDVAKPVDVNIWSISGVLLRSFQVYPSASSEGKNLLGDGNLSIGTYIVQVHGAGIDTRLPVVIF